MPPAAREAIDQHRGRLVSTQRPTAVGEGLVATGPVPRTTDFEDTGGPFYLDRECRTPDPLEDDQALFFAAAQGTVVLLGCAHSGVINTLRYVAELTGNRPIWAVIGGMHLGDASAERLDRTIEELRRLGVRLLGPGHCTGTPATVALWSAFPGRCLTCHASTRLEFETAAQSSSF
jgi:7,8-dihydropterin-6-yl-methyl-4-(beta-D-ribofuranosyl)aminobenzene 5'-phosphate synthase